MMVEEQKKCRDQVVSARRTPLVHGRSLFYSFIMEIYYEDLCGDPSWVLLGSDPDPASTNRTVLRLW